MQAYIASLMKNEIFLMVLAVATGLILGKIKIRGIGLGISGALFTGLFIGAFGYTVSKGFFYWNLVMFVTAVGLLAAEDIVMAIKNYGLKFVMLGILITFVGAVVTLALTLMVPNVDPHLVAGTYTGALTSSPGLGAALEATGGNKLVTVGHSVAYPFGVMAVVLFVQLAPAIFGINVAKEREEFRKEVELYEKRMAESGQKKIETGGFALLSFCMAMFFGIMLGKIKFPFPFVGKISLGTTGGCLIFALFAGAMGRLGPLPMRMDKKVLQALRAISLAFFLAIVGLRAGTGVVKAVKEHGLLLIGIGVFAALAAELVGFFVGRYVFKLNWIILSGAICGGMTSTPGLGAAIEAAGTEDVATGYGATYPIALVCMVLFTTLLHDILKAMGYV